MITYIEGNLLESEEKVIAHGCNCSGGFGSGFARQVALNYPKARENYLQRHESSGWQLGDVQRVDLGKSNGAAIYNCGTQQRYGRPDQGPYVSYPAIRSVIRELVKLHPEGFAIPKIGAGLAGGNWDIISEIMNDESPNTEVRVYLYKEAKT